MRCPSGLCDAIAELGLNLVSKSTGGLGRFASVGNRSGFRGNLGLFAGVSIEALPRTQRLVTPVDYSIISAPMCASRYQPTTI
jgi:hypothetical protein